MKYSSSPTLFIKVIQPRNLRNCFVLPASLPFRNNAISRFPLKDLNRIRLSCRKFSKGLPCHKGKSALTSNGNPKHKGQPQPTSQPLITSVRSAFLCENPQIYGFIDFSTPPIFCHCWAKKLPLRRWSSDLRGSLYYTTVRNDVGTCRETLVSLLATLLLLLLLIILRKTAKIPSGVLSAFIEAFMQCRKKKFLQEFLECFQRGISSKYIPVHTSGIAPEILLQIFSKVSKELIKKNSWVQSTDFSRYSSRGHLKMQF